MYKKRLVGVITVLNGWAVQSFGYCRYLPIGNPVVVAQNLDRWGVDEILILAVDRSKGGLGPNFDLLKSLGKASLSTPITYGGGVCNVRQALEVIQSGIERICLDALLHGDMNSLKEISLHVGSQALVAALPLSIDAGNLVRFNYITKEKKEIDDRIANIFGESLVSEALVIDWKNEGKRDGFNIDLLRRFPVAEVPLIAFGGLSEVTKINDVLCMPDVVAIGIGNFLNYKEHSVQNYKELLNNKVLRIAEYRSLV